jgi:hypothetical protein
MSGRVGHRKRLIGVNAANLRENHLYLTGHTDFFPADCYGRSTEKDGTGIQLRLDVLGLPAPVYTDIPTEARSGKPRRFFRKRAWVGEFFAKHGIKPGDTIAIERLVEGCVLNAADYGVPQTRKRAIVIGSSISLAA